MASKKMEHSALLLIVFISVLFRGICIGQISVKSPEEVPINEIINYNLSILKNDPQNFKAAIALVESYYRAEDYHKSILYANISEDILQDLQDSDFSTFNYDLYLFYIFQTRGKARHRLGMYERALDEYSAALEINDRDSDLLIDIGNLFYNQGEYDSAMYYFTMADRTDDMNFKSKFNMANVFYVR